MEYIVFIYKNGERETSETQWNTFFSLARKSGIFSGGSALGTRFCVGKKPITPITDSIGGYMRFSAETAEEVLELLKSHPVVLNGGTVELCETPKT